MAVSCSMNNNKKTKKSWNVSNTTRSAVVGAAEQMRILREKTAELAHKAGEKWEESNPQRQKAKDMLEKTAQHIVDFGKEVQNGFKEGIAEVQKRNKN